MHDDTSQQKCRVPAVRLMLWALMLALLALVIYHAIFYVMDRRRLPLDGPAMQAVEKEIRRLVDERRVAGGGGGIATVGGDREGFRLDMSIFCTPGQHDPTEIQQHVEVFIDKQKRPHWRVRVWRGNKRGAADVIRVSISTIGT